MMEIKKIYSMHFRDIPKRLLRPWFHDVCLEEVKMMVWNIICKFVKRTRRKSLIFMTFVRDYLFWHVLEGIVIYLLFFAKKSVEHSENCRNLEKKGYSIESECCLIGIILTCFYSSGRVFGVESTYMCNLCYEIVFQKRHFSCSRDF